jgi:hypothetical protein
MKLKSIHILIIIVILGGVLLFVNKKEKYTDVVDAESEVVILNPNDFPLATISGERENNIFCDTSNPDYPICLDFFKITHPKSVYNPI